MLCCFFFFFIAYEAVKDSDGNLYEQLKLFAHLFKSFNGEDDPQATSRAVATLRTGIIHRNFFEKSGIKLEIYGKVMILQLIDIMERWTLLAVQYPYNKRKSVPPDLHRTCTGLALDLHWTCSRQAFLFLLCCCFMFALTMFFALFSSIGILSVIRRCRNDLRWIRSRFPKEYDETIKQMQRYGEEGAEQEAEEKRHNEEEEKRHEHTRGAGGGPLPPVIPRGAGGGAFFTAPKE